MFVELALSRQGENSNADYVTFVSPPPDRLRRAVAHEFSHHYM